MFLQYISFFQKTIAGHLPAKRPMIRRLAVLTRTDPSCFQAAYFTLSVCFRILPAVRCYDKSMPDRYSQGAVLLRIITPLLLNIPTSSKPI